MGDNLAARPPLADATPDEAFDLGWIAGYDAAYKEAAPLEPGALAALTRALLDPDLMHGTVAMLEEVERRRNRAHQAWWGVRIFQSVREERERALDDFEDGLNGAKAYDRLIHTIEKITGAQA